jgi:pyruvate,water dikinase
LTATRQLGELEVGDVATAGRKATNLGALARRGFPVPPGVVAPVCAADDLLEAAVIEVLAVLGDGLLAVRSSAVAEDLDGASFAGQYETMLAVRGAAGILDAVRRIRAAAGDERVAVYRRERGPAGASGIAVLLQPMVAADASGVAFTAHPLTGAREETVVTAASGLGEQLVGGEAVGEQWIVRDGHAARDRRAAVSVLDGRQALAVAGLARRVEQFFGGAPQDIEWALAGGELYLLQARPMTALPEPARWEPTRSGGGARNFRLGEWLPEPVTPSCATWLLPPLEERFAQATYAAMGINMPRPLHVLVNGWYYYLPLGSGTAWQLLGLLRRPRFLWGTARAKSRPEVFHRLMARPETVSWRDELLPRYRALIEQHARQVDTADEAQVRGQAARRRRREKMRAPAQLRPGMLQGMPASPGRATGVARVLTDLADAGRLASGEILVTAATTPAWTPLFSRAAAIATDGGSLVAHASLIAREYGIPAVVALGDATRQVRDGQQISIDGNSGLLQIHD